MMCSPRTLPFDVDHRANTRKVDGIIEIDLPVKGDVLCS